MATRAFVIPVRNDLDGMGAQFTDVRPNSSGRNLIYDGDGQTGYLKHSLDPKGLTVVSGRAYVSGSTNTVPISALAAVVTAAPGNDANATTVTDFGLRAYLRDRVQSGGAGGGAFSVADSNTAANALEARLVAGDDLTLAAINVVLNAVVAGSELTVAGGSKSFGTVEEIIRIMSGEVYRVPLNTIITDDAGPDVFLTLAERTALVTAADVPALWTAAGAFLTADDAGYRNVRIVALSSDIKSSAAEGMLFGFSQAMSFRNPAFYYGIPGTNSSLPRAQTSAGVNVPATGVAQGLWVYDSAGNVW